MAGRSPSLFRFWLASWYGPNPVHAELFYKNVLYRLVWYGIYSSVPEAESDSLLRIIQHSRRMGEEAVQKSRIEILRAGMPSLG